jgi:hypothetical protein
MKKKIFLSLFVLLLAAAFATPKTVKAISGSVSVTVSGTQFYQSGDNARLHDATVYPCDGSQPTYYYVFPHPNDVWTDMGFQIKEVDYSWHYGESGGADYSDVAYGNCQVGVPLIQEWVYYSANPFFGNTHTLTLYSALGIPSELSVKYWAGGAFPEGFDYKKGPACTAILYDDGTDQGAFACDGFLKSVHERRAWLRNDPDGSKFDMEPKLESYFKMLKANGETPQQLP